MNNNTLLCTDVYKFCHAEMFPEDTTHIYSYLEARKPGHDIVWFGLQYYLQEYLASPITMENAHEFLYYYGHILERYSPRMVQEIMALAKLGYWPLQIKAAPEGSLIPSTNVLMTIRNTQPFFHWCVGFLESLLLKVWYPSTVATASLKYKKLVEQYAAKTCDNYDHIPFQVHDFGYRGVSSEESAMIAGASHLLNFSGSDTVIANWFLDNYYGATWNPKGKSVPASEHSVMCSYGREGEWDAFDGLLELYPTGIVSIVSDTYNYFAIMTDYIKSRKEKILARDGKVVFRPDSGDPQKIINGDGMALPVETPEFKGSLELLWETFGGYTNKKGYKVINPKVGLIYGDGMYYERFESVLDRMEQFGFASSNLVIGVGGILLQNHSRDEYGFALKATHRTDSKEQGHFLQKDPVTDPGKRSKTGFMKLNWTAEGGWKTVDGYERISDQWFSNLETVYENGTMLQPTEFAFVKERLSKAAGVWNGVK